MERFRTRRRKRPSHQALKDLFESVWGLSSTDIMLGRVRPEPYASHYFNVLEVDNLRATRLHGINESKKVAEIVAVVKDHPCSDIATAVDIIKNNGSIWASVPVEEAAARSALELACKLWLFSNPSLEDASCTLVEANKKLFLPDIGRRYLPFTELKLLSVDFSAKSLTRKGGFDLVWTSDLSEHLTFASRDQLRVFRHAHALQRYRDGPESDLYPDGFLEETHRTIHLLFPIEDIKTSKRVRRISRKQHVDIDAPLDLERAMDLHEQYRISSYGFYGPRLAEIQRRYDLARPRKLRQWWYDRRQKPEWAALIVALVVFVLTVIFGVIQSVTGILQVYGTFRIH